MLGSPAGSGGGIHLDGLQLLQQDIEPIQLADDRPSPPQVLQPLITPTLAPRLVAEHPLGEEQSF